MRPIPSRIQTAAVVVSAAIVTAGTLLVSAAPRADAACHFASFEQEQYFVGEADGTVTITVFLEGNQNTCSGSVRYTTEEGTATPPEDFAAAEGILCFRAGDEQKGFDVQISDDATYEGDEAFNVRLEDAGAANCQPDQISPGSTSSATVTVEEDDPRPAPTPPPATPTPAPTPQATEPVVEATPTPTPSPTPAASPSPSPRGSPTPAGESPTPVAAPEDADDGGVPGVLIGALVAAVLAIGAGVGLFLQARRT